MDQVTDMMVANAQNLIITVKPANQRNTLQRLSNLRSSEWSGTSDDIPTIGGDEIIAPVGNGIKFGKNDEMSGDDTDEDIVVDYLKENMTGNAATTTNYQPKYHKNR